MIEIGTISARGQIAIPASIRHELDLKEGTKVAFTIKDDTILIKKTRTQTWEDITRPLREAVAKSDLKEEDVLDIIAKVRARRRAK